MSNESGNGKYAPRPGNIPGVPVNLGGVDLVLAPLGLRLVREFEARGRAMTEGNADVEAVHAFNLDVVLASLLRNYPDITREDVEALLDSANEGDAAQSVFKQSGFKKVTPGELKPGG